MEANCTQLSQKQKREMDQINKDIDNLHLEAIGLRRDKLKHEREAELCKERCKTEFVQSLSGISNVTNAFLNKIDSLFSTHMPFHLTCDKQREHLDRIQFNCTSLSREIEEKFQDYLNIAGDQMSSVQAENSRLKAENWRLSEDYRFCIQNRSGLLQQHKQNINRLQEKHDQFKERLLIEKNNLDGEIMILNKTVNLKNTEVAYLAAQLKQLNLTCLARVSERWSHICANLHSLLMPNAADLNVSLSWFQTPFGTSYGGSRSSSSSNSAWNMFGNGGTGTGSFGGSSSSTGLGQTSRSGTASSSVYSGASSSSIGSSNNKPGSNGGLLSFFAPNPSSSSSGSGLNKPGVSGRSSTSSPDSGSTGTNLGYMGQGLEKSVTNTKSSPGSDASSSSSGSMSRSSSRFPWFASKSGSGTQKGPSGGNEDGGHPGK